MMSVNQIKKSDLNIFIAINMQFETEREGGECYLSINKQLPYFSHFPKSIFVLSFTIIRVQSKYQKVPERNFLLLKLYFNEIFVKSDPSIMYTLDKFQQTFLYFFYLLNFPFSPFRTPHTFLFKRTPRLIFIYFS